MGDKNYKMSATFLGLLRVLRSWRLRTADLRSLLKMIHTRRLKSLHKNETTSVRIAAAVWVELRLQSQFKS